MITWLLVLTHTLLSLQFLANITVGPVSSIVKRIAD